MCNERWKTAQQKAAPEVLGQFVSGMADWIKVILTTAALKNCSAPVKANLLESVDLLLDKHDLKDGCQEYFCEWNPQAVPSAKTVKKVEKRLSKLREAKITE